MKPHRTMPCRELTWTALIVLGLPTALQAQALSPEQLRQIDQQINISRDRAASPLPRGLRPDLRILTPEKAPIPRAVDELEFEVTQIAVDGATHFPKTEIDAYFAPLLKRKVSLADIRDAAGVLENRYRERGFFLTRVFVPPQQLKDGVFRVQVLEGHVSQIYLDSADTSMGARIEAYAQRIVGLRPLSLANLEHVLLLINDLPGVAVTAVLRPGAELGASELLLSVIPQGNVYLGTFNNTGSKTTGPYSLNYNATFQQVLGSTGQLNLSLTSSGVADNQLKATRSSALRYMQAVGASGLTFSLGGTFSNSNPGGTLAALDIESTATTFAPKLRYPLLRSRSSSIYVDGGLSINNSKTTRAGTALTADQSTVADLSVSWVLAGWPGGSQNLSLGLAKGTDLFGAMDRNAANPSSAGFEPHFTKLTYNVQHAQELPLWFSLRLNANGQHTNDKLLAGEQIAFGGPGLGRGYAPAAIAGDKGYGAMLELRYDFKQALAPDSGNNIGNIQAYFSIDGATTRTVAVPGVTAVRASISSKALGLRFSPQKNWQLDLRLAHATHNTPADDPNRERRLLVESLIRF